MLCNYVLIAWLNLKRHKVYSFINIAGLSAGMAVSILILSFVAHEFSFDHFHVRAGQLYRPLARINYGGQTVQAVNISAQFGPAVRRASPDVLDYVRIRHPRRGSDSDPV